MPAVLEGMVNFSSLGVILFVNESAAISEVAGKLQLECADEVSM